MNLDDRIREASEELQRRTSVDPVRGLGDLRRPAHGVPLAA